MGGTFGDLDAVLLRYPPSPLTREHVPGFGHFQQLPFMARIPNICRHRAAFFGTLFEFRDFTHGSSIPLLLEPPDFRLRNHDISGKFPPAARFARTPWRSMKGSGSSSQ